MERVKRLFELIMSLCEKKFYGRLEILFELGEIVAVKKVESIKI